MSVNDISGIFTATEGSVVAVVYSLILSLFFYRSIKISELPKIFLDSAEMTGIIIFLIGVSSIMSWVMAFTEIPKAVSTAMLSISDNRYVILFIINILLLIIGTFMDMSDLYPDLPADLPAAWNEYRSLWYHDDLQPVYRYYHTSCRNYPVCRC